MVCAPYSSEPRTKMLIIRCARCNAFAWRCIDEGIRSGITVYYRDYFGSVGRVLDCCMRWGMSSFLSFLAYTSTHMSQSILSRSNTLSDTCSGANEQLWDVCEDQQAVDLIRNIQDPQEASKKLLDHAMGNYSTDNLSVMVIRFY